MNEESASPEGSMDYLELARTFGLGGRRILVTGASGVLGGAIATALREAGASLVVTGRSAAIEDVGRRLGVHAATADLLKPDETARVYGEAREMLGGLDGLVLVHGIVRPGPALETSPADLEETLQANLSSVFALCQLAGADFVAQRSGKIVTIASMLSFSGGYRAAAYAASKGGLAQLTKALANEWAADGVNVNAIAPGYIRTPANRHVWSDEARAASILARLPSGRWGEPSDLGGAAVFLCSRASDYIHGIVLPVDGGWLAR
jgi:2-dehydro-3-deoxy-D-gluconate 5-dehydrogenase